MEELKSCLRSGESLLWSGQPSGIKAMDEQYKPGIIKRIIISLVLAIGISAAYIGVCASKSTEIKPGLIVIIAVIAAYLMISPFTDAKKLSTKFFYGITDQRLIIKMDKIKSVEYANISKAQFVEDAAGQTSLLVNEAIEEGKKGNIRTLAVTCTNKDEADFEAHAAMYAIPDAAAVKAILKEYIPFS